MADTKEKRAWELNRASNPHMAVVGTTGSGKTYFVKELLTQSAEQPKKKLPFIFFDYARGDVAEDKAFLKATGTQAVTIPQMPAPLTFAELSGCRRCSTSHDNSFANAWNRKTSA